MITPIAEQTIAATAEQNQHSSETSCSLNNCEPPAGPVTSRYELQAILARGGMGAVYRAHDHVLQRSVAVKVMHNHLLRTANGQRFAEEAIITGRLQHPSIPPIYDLGTLADGQPYMAMKLIEGHTLESLIIEHRTSLNILAIFESICQAMGYAHAKGIIHRDLKPANIMVGSFGEVQVMDWGLAKQLHREDASLTQTPLPRAARNSDSTQTEYGSIMGTPAYMPPEQAAGQTNLINERSDVFGLGAILCAMLTGQPPFPSGDIETQTLLAPNSAMQEVYDRLNRCGAEPALIDLAKQCLQADPLDRPANGDEVAKIVAKLRHEAEERAKTAIIAKASSDARRRWVVGTAAVIVVLLSMGVGGSLWQLDRARYAEQQTVEQLLLTKLETQRAQEAEKWALAAGERAQQATRELAHANETIFDVFADFDIRRVKLSNQPVEVVLAKKLLVAGTRLNAETIRDPVVLANLQHRLGQTLASLGYLKESLDYFKTSYAIRLEKLGEEHTDTIRCKIDLARGYLDLRETAKSVKLNEEIVAIDHATLPANHPDRLMAMNNLARGYELVGKQNRALELYRETLERRTIVLGPDHIDTIRSMNNLANGYLALRDWDQAIPQYEKAYARAQAVLGADHFITIGTMGNLASCYVNAGQGAQAVPLFEQIVRRQQLQLGRDHPMSLLSSANLAAAYLQTGQIEKAIPLYEDVLATNRVKLGESHPHTIQDQYYLGIAYSELEQFERAYPCFLKTLSSYRASYGPSHTKTREVLFKLALVEKELGQHQAALDRLNELQQQPRQGQDFEGVLQCNIGLCYYFLNRDQDAIAILEPLFDDLKDHTKMLTALLQIVNSYDRLGKRDDAIGSYDAVRNSANNSTNLARSNDHSICV